MKKILSTILALAACTTLTAQDFKITHGPWLCDLTSDGVTVVWATSKPALSWVEVAEDDGRSFYAAEHERRYETVAGRKQARKTLHSIRLKGLRPDTKYRYRIFSQEVREWKYNDKVYYGDIAASNVYSRQPVAFSTLPTSGCDLSFVVLNDIHGRADYMAGLCRPIDFAQIDFVAFNGDMSNSTESPEQLYRDFIDASVGAFASETPILYNRGNHETRGIYADHLPEYFPKVGGNYYKLYMAGSVAVLLLDCGEDKPDSDIEYGGLGAYDAYREEEAAWLRETVASEEFRNASARIVLLHIPLGNGTWHGNIHLEELFLPILNDADIDVMLSGHTHRYSFHPANDKVRFPVLVNDNASLLKCDVGDGKITARIYGPEGTVTHSHEFPLK